MWRRITQGAALVIGVVAVSGTTHANVVLGYSEWTLDAQCVAVASLGADCAVDDAISVSIILDNGYLAGGGGAVAPGDVKSIRYRGGGGSIVSDFLRGRIANQIVTIDAMFLVTDDNTPRDFGVTFDNEFGRSEIFTRIFNQPTTPPHNVFYTGPDMYDTVAEAGIRTAGWTYVPAVVPIPAALPLFLTALAGLGFMARRKRGA